MGKKFNLEDYDLVKDRIEAYIEKNPDYRVETEVLFAGQPNADVVIVKASVFKSREDQIENVPHATGIAEETRDAGFVNKTSHVENAETSAIGRALANVAFKISDNRPSREEMEKVERTKKAKEQKKEKKDKVPEGDIEEKIDSFNDRNKLVAFFNQELEKRSGDKKTEFEDKYYDLVNKKLKDISK